MHQQDVKRAEVLSPSQIRYLLRVTEATSRHSEKDAVILLLGLGCGMRITEIAQVTVAGFYFSSGDLRREISLRGAITKGCRHRERFLKSYEARCITVVDSRIKAKRRYIHGDQSAISWYATRIIKKAMSNPTQQEFLKSAKDALGVTWDELAESAGINPRALKTYRMPDTSKDYRPLPALARAAVDRLMSGHKTKGKINA